MAQGVASSDNLANLAAHGNTCVKISIIHDRGGGFPACHGLASFADPEVGGESVKRTALLRVPGRVLLVGVVETLVWRSPS